LPEGATGEKHTGYPREQAQPRLSGHRGHGFDPRVAPPQSPGQPHQGTHSGHADGEDREQCGHHDGEQPAVHQESGDQQGEDQEASTSQHAERQHDPAGRPSQGGAHLRGVERVTALVAAPRRS
jgi:hypothetical protein